VTRFARALSVSQIEARAASERQWKRRDPGGTAIGPSEAHGIWLRRRA